MRISKTRLSIFFFFSLSLLSSAARAPDASTATARAAVRMVSRCIRGSSSSSRLGRSVDEIRGGAAVGESSLEDAAPAEALADVGIDPHPFARFQLLGEV